MKSNCCNEDIIEERYQDGLGVCSKCKEHCEVEYTSEDLDGLPFESQVQIIEG